MICVCAHQFWASPEFSLSWATWLKRTETIYTHTATVYIGLTFLFHSLLQHKLPISGNSCPEDESWSNYCLFLEVSKKLLKWSFNCLTLQQKISTDSLLPKILWTLAASFAVAINLKLLLHDPYPILIKPLIERASETRLQNLVDLPTLPSPLQDPTKTLSYWEKNEHSLILTTGCPGAIWGEGSIQRQSHLSSQPSLSSGTHSDFRQRGYGFEGLWSSRTKALVLCSTHMALGDLPGPTCKFNVLLSAICEFRS